MQQEHGKVAMIKPYLLIRILTAIQSVLIGVVFMVQLLKMSGENQRKRSQTGLGRRNLLSDQSVKRKQIMQSKYDAKVSSLWSNQHVNKVTDEKCVLGVSPVCVHTLFSHFLYQVETQSSL